MFAFEVVRLRRYLSYSRRITPKKVWYETNRVLFKRTGEYWLDAKTGPLVYWIKGLSSAMYSKLTLPLSSFVNSLSVDGGGHDVPFIKTNAPENRQFGIWI
ncbi:hypothetical protein Hanom_Chr16g01464621 [Helianthus anomalus]